MLPLLLTACERVLNSGCICLPGYISAMGLSWICGDNVTDAGKRPRPSSSCTKAGWCCKQLTGFWSFDKHTGLMRCLAGLCSTSSAYGVILNWMSWTSVGCEQKLWLLVGRSLLGAYKLLRPSGTSGCMNQEMQQALWACFLPGMLSLMVLSNSIRMIGCSVSQVAQCNAPSKDASMCPLQIYPAAARAFCTVWMIARLHLMNQASAWSKKHVCLWISSNRCVDWAQGATGIKAAARAMVERLADSSSGEYQDLLGDEEEDMSADGAPAEVPPPTRVIRDRLGQIVREPPGPPPGYEERVRRQEEAAREIYDSSEEEEARDEGDEAVGGHGGPPRGPPPPNPAFLQEVQSISMQLSTTVAQALALTNGQIVTVLPPYWRDLRRVHVQIRGMLPNDALHPHVVHLADDRPPGLAAFDIQAGPDRPEGLAVPPPGRTDPETPGAPPRRRRRSSMEIDDGATTAEAPGPEQAEPSSSHNTSARLSPADIEEAIADLELRTIIEELEAEDAEEGPQMAQAGVGTAENAAETGSSGLVPTGTSPGLPAAASPPDDPRSSTTSMASSSRPPSAASPMSPSSRKNRKHRPHLWESGFAQSDTAGITGWNPSSLYKPVCSGATSLTWRSERVQIQPKAKRLCDFLLCLGRGRSRELPQQYHAVPGQNKERHRDPTSSACTFLFTSALTATPLAARYSTTTFLPTLPVALILLLLLFMLYWQQLCSTPRHDLQLGWLQLSQANSQHLPSFLISLGWSFGLWCTGWPGWTRTTPNLFYRSRPGPKSRNCSTATASGRKIMLFVMLLGLQLSQVAAVDARVELPVHRWSSGAEHLSTPEHNRAKPGESRNTARSSTFSAQGNIRKRALRRAIERAHKSTDGYTWYRGRRLHHQQLCSGKFRQEQPRIQAQQTLQNQREARTLRMISWNTGGLHSARYNEVLVWLDAQASAGRPVDLMFLQETHWKQDYEYVATPVEGKALQYRVIHSAGDDKAGLMCMIRTGLVPDSHIRHQALLPGRLLHIRLMFPTPVDIMNTYQFAWNLNKAAGVGHDTKHKVDTLMRQRRRVWKHLEQWLRGTPHRHGCLIVGDLNTPVAPDPPVAGTGTVDNQKTQQQDQETFQEMLRPHHCSVLNSWAAPGWKARTFIPPGPDDRKQGTQIDFFIARGVMDTAMSRKAAPFDAQFVPTTGCRHRPLQAEFALPRIRYHRDPPKHSAQQVRAHLRHPQQAAAMLGQIASDLDQAQEMDDLDQILLRGWEMVKSHAPPRQVPLALQAHQMSTRDRVMHMWRLRAELRRLGHAHSEDATGRNLKSIWDSWSKAAKLQRTNRQLRKDCRQRKTLKIIDAINSDNVFVAAKRFAPKQPRRRLQLRSKEGHLQSHEAEFEQICSYFRDLFKGPEPPPCPLPEQVTFTEEEVSQALGKLAAGKAMPSTSAPAAIWKLASAQVTPVLCKQFSAVLVAGATALPIEWSKSELILLPKPGKSLTSPSQLRPINLLPLQAKVLGAMLATRLQEYAQGFLREVPQYAYLQGRSLGQALERVAGQCAAIRSKLQAQNCNPHAKKEGHRLTQVGGGCFLSLDISKAYDHVDWGDLTQALAAAKVPESLISLVMMIHREARIRIQHCGHDCTIAMGRGLRQGCSLAPILWSIYSGWVLTKLHRPGLVDIPKCNTSYADDLFFGWTISSGQEMAMVYRAIRHILDGLGKQGLQLSLDKTVIVLGLKGPGAATCLKRYVVERAGMQGQFMKFQIEGEAAYVKIVKQHLYLGAQISFQKYEQATAKYRMGLAQGAYTRLAPVLKCRTVPLKLRLHLWQGTILPTLLHGLDCLGLLPTEAAQMMTIFYQQARAIAKSFSMYTHETNMQFARRLKLASPLRRLLKAIDLRAKTDYDLSPSLRAGDVQLQWRHFVRGQLSEAQDALGTSAGPKPQQSCSLLQVQDIIPEVFSCSECGISYGTQAALKRHVFRQHMTEEEQLQTIQTNRRELKGDAMMHARSGLPQCRHCLHKFTTWPAFFYHVNTNSCPALRTIGDNVTKVEALSNMNEALVENQDILSMAGHCTWRQLAEHPKTRSNHHRCPECHQWHARPQYVKRHMLSRHQDQEALVKQSEELIVKSNLSIANPCPFCGLSYQRKSAHLKSCIGLFNGVYLYLRIARGPALTSLGEGTRHGEQRAHGDRPAAAGSCDQRAGSTKVIHPGRDTESCTDSINEPRKRPNGITSGQLAGGPNQRRAPAKVPQGRPQGCSRQGPRPKRTAEGSIRKFLEVPSCGTGCPPSDTLEGLRELPVEGRRVDGHGPSPNQGCDPDAHHRGDPAREPTRDSPPGHVLRALRPHGRPRLPCEIHICHSSAVAGNQGQNAGETSPSDENHTVPTCDQGHDGKVRDDGGKPVVPLHGSLPGLDEHGRAKGEWTEVGFRGSQACEGRSHPAARDTGDQGGPAGDPGGMCGTTGCCPLPCHTKIGPGIHQSEPHDDAGDWPANRTGQSSVATAEPAGEIWSMGCGRSLPTTGRHAAECPGSAISSHHELMNLRLGNRGNHCYGNAALRGFIAAAVAHGGLCTMFNGGMLGFVERLLRSKGTVFLWAQPFWAALTREWELPERQHDGAEFILFLLRKLPFTADHATATWQARQRDGDTYRVTDWGRSAPLLLHPPSTAQTADCQRWSVQKLLQCWKEQDALHAFSMPPGVLLVQIGRFSQADAHAGGV